MMRGISGVRSSVMTRENFRPAFWLKYALRNVRSQVRPLFGIERMTASPLESSVARLLKFHLGRSILPSVRRVGRPVQLEPKTLQERGTRFILLFSNYGGVLAST